MQKNSTTWQNRLVKKSRKELAGGEVTPFVFQERLYRLDNWHTYLSQPFETWHTYVAQPFEGPDLPPSDGGIRVWDVEADKLVSVALTGHMFGMAFVWQDRVYVFAAKYALRRDWSHICTEVSMTSSVDLQHWSEPQTVLRAENNENLYNVGVCRGPDKFVLLYETNDPQWPPFTFKYCVSDDLVHWQRVPDAIYGREKYVGGPALYFEGGWFYTLYLESLGNRRGYETHITRSRDLIHWQDAPEGRPFLTFDPRHTFWCLDMNQGLWRKAYELNVSDIELCQWHEKTLVYALGGNQQSGGGDLQELEFAGTPRELLESFYEEPVGALPSARQLAYQEKQFGAFIHFGPATYTGNSDLSATPPVKAFNPVALDAGQWVRTAQAMGARHAVLTAKHHNGFCLWPTKTTDYRASRDIVGEFVSACRKYGIAPGLYISAGDRHFPCWSTLEPDGKRKLVGDREKYAPVLMEQLREILTGYGELCVLWFDGCGNPLDSDAPGAGRKESDAILALFRKLQPNAVLMSQPDARWGGNQDGLVDYPVWSKRGHWVPPGGSGWFVSEANVFTRPYWFWTPDSDARLAPLDRLLDIYYRSIGHGGNLLVNLTPDTSGLIPDAEVKRATEFGAEVQRRFGAPLAVTDSVDRWGEGNMLELDLNGAHTVEHVILEEDLRYGQRIRQYRLEARCDGSWQTLDAGASCGSPVIGRRRIERLAPVRCDRLRLRVLQTEPLPRVKTFAAFGVK